jgi:ADP-ribose pyrophosphatase
MRCMLYLLGRFLPKLGPCLHGPFFLRPGDALSDDAIDLIERETVYQGFFRVDRYRLRHRLFAGGWSPELSREVLERGAAAAVLLYDPERDAVVLIEQFRLAAHLAGRPGWQLEIVAGMIDPGSVAAAVARRETREETGLDIIGDLVPVHRYLTSPGGTTETVDVFCGRVDSRNATGIHGLAAEHEDIRVIVKPYAEAQSLIEAGGVDNGFTLLAFYWLAARRERLRRLWLQS